MKLITSEPEQIPSLVEIMPGFIVIKISKKNSYRVNVTHFLASFFQKNWYRVSWAFYWYRAWTQKIGQWKVGQKKFASQIERLLNIALYVSTHHTVKTTYLGKTTVAISGAGLINEKAGSGPVRSCSAAGSLGKTFTSQKHRKSILNLFPSNSSKQKAVSTSELCEGEKVAWSSYH